MLMTKQEAFNRVVSGLASQGFQPSVDKRRNLCLYRKDGTAKCKVRCGIGHLIPDDKYYSALEFESVRYKLIQKAAGIDHFTEQFNVDLQQCHDLAFWYSHGNHSHIHPVEKRPQKMRQNLIAFAIKYSLEIPPELAVDASLMKDGEIPAQTP